MAFRRGNTFYVDLKLPGYGRRIGPLSTRTRRRSVAEQQEATLRELAATGRHDLLDAVRGGEVHGHRAPCREGEGDPRAAEP